MGEWLGHLRRRGWPTRDHWGDLAWAGEGLETREIVATEDVIEAHWDYVGVFGWHWVSCPHNCLARARRRGREEVPYLCFRSLSAAELREW